MEERVVGPLKTPFSRVTECEQGEGGQGRSWDRLRQESGPTHLHVSLQNCRHEDPPALSRAHVLWSAGDPREFGEFRGNDL